MEWKSHDFKGGVSISGWIFLPPCLGFRRGSPRRMGCGESGRIDAAGGAIYERVKVAVASSVTIKVKINQQKTTVGWFMLGDCYGLLSFLCVLFVKFISTICTIPCIFCEWSQPIVGLESLYLPRDRWSHGGEDLGDLRRMTGRTTWKFREGVFGWVGWTEKRLVVFVPRLSLGKQVLLRVGANEMRRSSHWKEQIAM